MPADLGFMERFVSTKVPDLRKSHGTDRVNARPGGVNDRGLTRYRHGQRARTIRAGHAQEVKAGGKRADIDP